MFSLSLVTTVMPEKGHVFILTCQKLKRVNKNLSSFFTRQDYNRTRQTVLFTKPPPPDPLCSDY